MSNEGTPTGAKTWHATCPREDLPTDGTGRTIEIDGRALALFHVDDELHAIEGTCPHRGASLGDGVVVEGDISCPWHSFHFDLKSGCNTDGLNELSVEVYPLRVRADGMIEVKL